MPKSRNDIIFDQSLKTLQKEVKKLYLLKKKKPVKRKLKKNPFVTVFGNPPDLDFKKLSAKLISRNVFMIAYKHANDKQNYKHDFDLPGISMFALSNGSILLIHKTKRLWEDL